MDQRHLRTDLDAEELGRFLAGLPAVGSLADVQALPGDAEGVHARGLTDEMLLALAERTPGLRFLASDGTARVTDAGLSLLARFPRLEWLDLEGSAVSDAGLPLIAAVPSLRWVDVGESSGVTAAGLARLRAERPDLEVEPQDS